MNHLLNTPKKCVKTNLLGESDKLLKVLNFSFNVNMSYMKRNTLVTSAKRD